MIKTFSKKLIAIFVLLAMLIVSAIIGVSYAWLFVGSNEVNLQLDSGSFILQYFHCGDGTKEETWGYNDKGEYVMLTKGPFVITRPIHYYHMVELYQRRPDFAKGNLENNKNLPYEPYYFQIGYNLDNSKDGSLEVYNYDDTGAVVTNTSDKGGYKGTQFSDTLNMAYYSGSLALLPMGTSAVPFIGALDGKGMTVKNLHITATETVQTTDEKGKPIDKIYGTSDIGVFGYIGGEYKKDSDGKLILLDDSGNQVSVNEIKKDASGSMIIEDGKYVIATGGYAHPTYEGGFVHDVFYDNVTIDIQGLTNATEFDATGSVHPSLTHMSHVDGKVYIGYLVGHLPVIYLDENGYNADSIFSNVYINNCEIIGGETETLGVVQYGYIGHLDLLQYPDIQPATIEKMIQQMPSSGSGGTSGGTEGGGVLPGWGGSLDMRSLYDKLSDRIGGAIGNALIGFINPARYITRETIYEEVTKDTEGNVIKREVVNHVTEATANETEKPRRFTVYDDGKYGYEGTLYVYNEWNGSWICLSRSSELHKKNVTYYTVTKGTKEPAITLEYNGKYLGRDNGGTAVKDTDTINASNLTWDKDANRNFAQGQDANGNYQGYLYTHNSGENAQFYLDTDGFNLYFDNSTQKTHTVWHFEYDNDEKSLYTVNGKNHRIFTVIDGVKYYIVYGDSVFGEGCGWTVFPEKLDGSTYNLDLFKIKCDSDYLIFDGTTTTENSNATKFIKNGNTVYTVKDSKAYFLNATATSLKLETTNTNTVWNIEDSSLYATINSKKYYIINGNYFGSNNTGFVMAPSDWENSLKAIKYGDYYMQIISPTEFSGTTLDNASRFICEDNNKFYTYYNNICYYVNPGLNTSVKPTDTTPTNTWTISGNSCYSKIGGQTYYLIYDATDSVWRSVLDSELIILTNYTGEGETPSVGTYYMITDGSSITGSQSIKDATLFISSRTKTNDEGEGYFYVYNSSGSKRNLIASRVLGVLTNGLEMGTSTRYTYWKVNLSWRLYYDPSSQANSDRYLRCSNGSWNLGESNDTNTLVIERNYSSRSDFSLEDISLSSTSSNKKQDIECSFYSYVETQKEPQYETVEEETVLVIDPSRYNANEIIGTVTNSDGSISKVQVAHYFVTLFDGYIGDYKVDEDDDIDSTNYTYLPLTTKTELDEDKDYNPYEASYWNTGYLISGSHSSSLWTGVDVSRSDVRVARYSLTSIDNSLTTEQDAQGNDRNFTTNPFNETDDKRLEILTITQDGTTYRIKDVETDVSKHNSTNAYPSTTINGYQVKGVEELGLLGYQDLWGYYEPGSTTLKHAKFARDNLYTMMNGDSYVYGLHFMDAQISFTESTPVNQRHLMKAEYVRILGHDYQQYQFPESCIDFRVENSGRVSFFAGNWTSSVDPREEIDAFFSLNYVQRDEYDNISWIREIREIYRNNTDSSKYMYRFSDGSYWVTGSGNDAGLYSGSGSAPLAYYTSIFNMNLIAPDSNANGLNLIDNAIYYFEIPVCAGEFALGSVAGHTGAYLLYLDIGANSSNPIPVSDTLQENMPIAKISNDAVFTNLDYRVNGQTINVDDKDRHRSIITLSYTMPSNATSENFSIEVVYQGKYQNASDCLDDATDVTKRTDYNDLVDGEGNNWCEGVYQIYIKNTTAEKFYLSVLLTDDDDDHTNIFPFAYEILVYQNGNYVASPNNESSATESGGTVGYNGTLRRWSRNYIVNMDGTVDIKK